MNVHVRRFMIIYKLNFLFLDQGVIFMFIAANFTPFAVGHLSDPVRWLVLSAMWTLALFGFSSKVFWKHQVDSISIWHYLALGWLPALVIVPIVQSLPLEATVLFAAIIASLFIHTKSLLVSQDKRASTRAWPEPHVISQNCSSEMAKRKTSSAHPNWVK